MKMQVWSCLPNTPPSFRSPVKLHSLTNPSLVLHSMQNCFQGHVASAESCACSAVITFKVLIWSCPAFSFCKGPCKLYSWSWYYANSLWCIYSLYPVFLLCSMAAYNYWLSLFSLNSVSCTEIKKRVLSFLPFLSRVLSRVGLNQMLWWISPYILNKQTNTRNLGKTLGLNRMVGSLVFFLGGGWCTGKIKVNT